MNEEQIDRVLDSLEAIGGQAAELGGQAFEVMIRQQVLFGWALLIGGIVVLAGYISVIVATWLYARRHDPRSRYASKYEALGWAVGIGAPLGVGSIIAISNGVLRILNPTYYVIQEILRAL